MTPGFVLDIANDPAAIGAAVEAMREFGRRHALSDREVGSVCLAIDELLTNVIHYGCADGGAHRIALCVQLLDDRLVVEISDDGMPFDPFREAPAPDLDAPLETRRIGGVGVHLVRTLMDETSYCRDGDTNRIVIARKLFST